MNEKYTNSVIKACNLLDILIFQDTNRQGLSLTELSNITELKPNALRHILKTLIYCGYVTQDERSRYLAGSKSVEAGKIYFFQSFLSTIFEPILSEVNQQINETILLYTLINGKRQRLLFIEHEGPIKVDVKRVKSEKIYSYATGRVLTAFADRFEREYILEVWGYPEESWDNLREEKAFVKALEGIRKQGFCELLSEEQEVYTVAFPLLLPGGDLLGAIGCYAPIFRCPAEKQQEILHHIKHAAEQIQAKLS
jgi:IclR family transcriptional regulator, KDG regulon repressor